MTRTLDAEYEEMERAWFMEVEALYVAGDVARATWMAECLTCNIALGPR